MKIFTIFALVVLCVSPALAEEKIKYNVKDADVLIDVRTEQEFASGHFDGAINIRYKNVFSEIVSFVKSKEDIIYVYCRRGGRSKKVKEDLTSIGYKNAQNIGGYLELLKQQKRF